MIAENEIRVALIGHRFMGVAHSNAFRNARQWMDLPVRIVMKCVCAEDTAENLQAFSTKYGWESWETDWRKVVAREDIDVISIATPNFLHHAIAVAAVQQGKHVLCEKPLANSLEEANEMFMEAQKAGVYHCCGYSYRFTPSLALARQFVQEGRLGRIYHVVARYAQDWIADPDFGMVWRFDKKLAGSGSLGDLAAHSIDATRFITDLNFKEVAGNLQTLIKERPLESHRMSGAKGRVTVDDVAQFLVNFENGATGFFEATRLATGRKNHNMIEVNGEKGSIVWNFENQNYLLFYDRQQPVSEQGFRQINATHDEHPYKGGWWPQGHGIGYADLFIIQVGEFIRSIIDHAPFHPDFEDGLICQRVLHAVEQSSVQRAWMKV